MNNRVICTTNVGSTWLQVMLLQLGVHYKWDRHGFNHKEDLTFEEISNKYPPIKTNNNMAILYRDPRDIVVSQYMHLTHRFNPPKYQGTLQDCIRDPKHGVEKYIRYYLLFKEYDYSKKFVFSYEEMHDNCFKTLKSLCEFFGYNFTNEHYKKVVEFSTFENLKQHEINQNKDIIRNKVRYTEGNPESFKMRKGKVGGYIDYMTPEDNEYCNDLLVKYNFFERMKN